MTERSSSARSARGLCAAWALASSLSAAGPLPVHAAAAAFGAPKSAATVADRLKARRAQQEGDAKLARGDLDGALASFLIAVTTVPSPEGFLLVARLHDKLGHAHEAVAAYEAYLQLSPTKEVDEARTRVAALRSTPGHVVLRGSPESARVTIGEDRVFDGFPVEVDLPPAEHRVHISADGYVAQEFVLVVSYAQASSPSVDLEPVERRPPIPVLDLGRAEPVPLPPELVASLAPMTPTGPSWSQRHQTVLVVAGVGVVALGAGVAFGVQTLDAQADFARDPSKGAADRGERAAFRADLAFGTAILLGTTATLLLLGEGGAKPKASVQITPIVGASVVGLGAGAAL